MSLREMTYHFIRVHVGGGAAAGLKHIYNKMFVVGSLRDFVRRILDSGRQMRRDVPGFAVTPGSCSFNQTKCSEKGPG
jgi:hypothetical protein